MRKSVKRAVVIGTTLAVAGVAGAAWASWVAGGDGTASAQAGTASELTTNVVTTDATLFPGVTGDSTISINNPNPYPVKVTSIVWNPSDGVQATPVAGKTCGNTGVYFGDFSQNNIGTNGVLSGLDLEIAKGDSAQFTLPKTVHMINNSEDGCQGATFSIKVHVSGVSNAS
ncbi:hypothetical protein ACIA5C_31380 [Actinoplanes sp. NPDC051343]|jgi:hypothetical protein|uniref:hypothetical protein n=1 Tax=Actinoplanes sp. NPDC051343 TaxID=3363906 RepID=UPI00378F3D64